MPPVHTRLTVDDLGSLASSIWRMETTVVTLLMVSDMGFVVQLKRDRRLLPCKYGAAVVLGGGIVRLLNSGEGGLLFSFRAKALPPKIV